MNKLTNYKFFLKRERRCKNMFSKKGFTLIELLIVVAIIAILAAIAVPNFLEAQVRSKVSRVKADMRSCATALEAYCIDHNAYIPDGYNSIPAGAGWWTLNYMLTTPIAYISSLSAANDPFKVVDNPAARLFRYTNFKFTYLDRLNNPSAYNSYSNIVGEWMMMSWGPDKLFGPDGSVEGRAYALVVIYDSTNGTVSAGDIVRCQKYSETIKYQ